MKLTNLSRLHPSRLLPGIQARWAGLKIEIKGNKVTSRGVRLRVDHDVIPTVLKGLLALDRYEGAEARALRAYPPPSLDVIELGGGIGFLSCLLNEHLAPGRTHVVVEPNPHLTDLLESNLELNGCRCEVVEAAYAGDDEPRFLPEARGFEAAGTEARGRASHRVPGISLRSLIERFGIGDFALAMDVEGAELQLFDQEFDVLEDCYWLLLELHPGEVRSTDLTALDRLEQIGLQQRWSQEDRSGNKVVLFERRFGNEAPESPPPN